MNCNLRFLAIFFFHCFQFCMSIINIKCISYCSLWQCNLLCVILQISSTNLCMPLILFTSLISPNFHHIPREKINPLLYFFAELHSYTTCSNQRQIISCHFMTMFWDAHLQHRFALSQIATKDTTDYSANSKVYLGSTYTVTLRKINWHNMSFHTHHTVHCIPITSKGREGSGSWSPVCTWINNRVTHCRKCYSTALFTRSLV